MILTISRNAIFEHCTLSKAFAARLTCSGVFNVCFNKFLFYIYQNIKLFFSIMNLSLIVDFKG